MREAATGQFCALEEYCKRWVLRWDEVGNPGPSLSGQMLTGARK